MTEPTYVSGDGKLIDQGIISMEMIRAQPEDRLEEMLAKEEKAQKRLGIVSQLNTNIKKLEGEMDHYTREYRTAVSQAKAQPTVPVFRTKAKNALRQVKARQDMLEKLESRRGTIEQVFLTADMAIMTAESTHVLRQAADDIRLAKGNASVDEILGVFADTEQLLDDADELSTASSKPIQQKSAFAITDAELDAELDAVLMEDMPILADGSEQYQSPSLLSTTRMSPPVSSSSAQRRRPQQQMVAEMTQ